MFYLILRMLCADLLKCSVNSEVLRVMSTSLDELVVVNGDFSMTIRGNHSPRVEMAAVPIVICQSIYLACMYYDTYVLLRVSVIIFVILLPSHERLGFLSLTYVTVKRYCDESCYHSFGERFSM